MFRFAGFELDKLRARIQGPDGEPIRLRPKPYDMLLLFVANPGRVVSKQELIEAIWPDVHVSDDSLFQCIRELRAALGDERRELIRLVSGRGYVFEAEVSEVPNDAAVPAETASSDETTVHTPVIQAPAAPEPVATALPPAGQGQAAARLSRYGLRSAAGLAIAAAVGAVAALAVAVPFFGHDLLLARTPTVLVQPITAAADDRQAISMASGVTTRLTDGLAKIEKLRVLAPRVEATSAAAVAPVAAVQPQQADFVVSGELQSEERGWMLKARLSNGRTGEVRWAGSVPVAIEAIDASTQESRLTAGIGHPLALRLNAIVNSAAPLTAANAELRSGSAKVVIEQAMASINQTTPERFRMAQAMLEKALAAEPDNVDLEAALAAHWMRGIQMTWYSPVDVPAAKRSAQAALDRALQAKPSYVPVLEGQCRFLAATNHFIESLVACARVLSFDPWDGLALYNMGLSQMQLGRLDDALATFKLADQYDTPVVSRWTWLLGAGLTCLLMDRNEEAVTYLNRSIAITPASGRSDILLAAALQRVGQTDEAKRAMARGLELRPGSNAVNAILPTENASPVFLAALQRLLQSEAAAGLPDR